MTIQSDIAFFHLRIAEAQADRDAWRASGRQEKYLAACSLVGALGVRLDNLERAARGASAKP